MPEAAVPAFGDVDLDAVEDAVVRALADRAAAAGDSGLSVLGYGEISLVIGWPATRPTVACKRLPRFPSPAAAEEYRERFEAYLALLVDRGVRPVRSEFRTVTPPRGGHVVGYVMQTVLPGDRLGPEVLRSSSPDPDQPMLRAVTDCVLRVCDDHTGLDAQISNWAHDADGLHYLDVTTPMRFDDAGRMDLDMGLFLAAYPWALRAVIGRFVAPGVVGAYRDPRHVLVDMTANLIKERLSGWIPAVLEVVNDVVSPAVGEAEVERYYRSDARLWEAMSRLRRADRWWQRNIRRREYPFLLPGPVERW